jgi:hypothetical protein
VTTPADERPPKIMSLPNTTACAGEAYHDDAGGDSLTRPERSACVSVPTLVRIERSAPTVALGAYAVALWALGLLGDLARVADPSTDERALVLDLRRLPQLALPPEDRAGALSFGLSSTPPAPVRQFNRTLQREELLGVASSQP